MKVRDIIEKLGLKLVSGKKGIDRKIEGGYCGDLLSDVIGNAPKGCIWVTVQTHPNIVAVAILKEMAGIIISANHQPEEDTRKKSDAEGIPLLISPLTSFQTTGQLYELGIGKNEDI